MRGVECLGFRVREVDNARVGEMGGVVVAVGGGGGQEGGGGPEVLVCRTDEAAEMARGCVQGKKFWG